MHKKTGCPPAGGQGAAAADPFPGDSGQRAGGDNLGVIVANQRDRRTLAWLRERVDDAAIVGAVGQLEGNRKPYLSNIAKILGVALPERLEAADRETALKHLADIRVKLKG